MKSTVPVAKTNPKFLTSKILTVALLLILPFFLAACTIQDLPVIGKLLSKAPKGSSGPVTLNMWGMWQDPEVMNELITKYKETHPNVTINYDDRSVLKVEDYKENVYNRAAGEDAPDIVVVHNSWVAGLKDSLAPATDGDLSPSNYSQKYYPVAAQSAVLDDKVYALPMYYDGLVLVYNKAHFEEIDQSSPPTAWEEFRRIAIALTIHGTDGNLVRGGAAIGTADNIDFFSDILGLMFSQAKVIIPDELDTKPAQDAMSFYTNFVKEDKVWSGDMPEASAAFAGERASMIFVPTWNLMDILALRPDLEVGVARVPQALTSDPTSWGSFWMTSVTAGSKNPAEAWEFLKFLAENDQQLTMFSKASELKPYGPAFSSVELKSQLDNNNYLRPLIEDAPYARSARIASRAGNRTAIAGMKTAVNSMLERADPVQVMKVLKDTVTNTR
jgi:multiple sugar transport system substrate-binding protein